MNAATLLRTATTALTLMASPAAGLAWSDARDDILAMYRQGCNAVALPDPHGRVQLAEFRESLIRHPDFADTVDTIAVEYASAFHQDLLDRWVVDGEDLSLEEVRPIWRDTMEIFAWNTPSTEQFFRSIRDLNLQRPVEDRVRILALAPPVDWANAESPADIEPFMERGRLMPERIDQEALSRDEHVLIIVGSGHYARPGGSGSAYLDARFPGELCVILAVVPDDDTAAHFAVSQGIDPDTPHLFFPLNTSPVGRLRTRDILRYYGRGRLGQAADALLFIGTDTSTEDDDPSTLEPAYRAERRRRVRLLWPDGPPIFFKDLVDQLGTDEVAGPEE